MGNSWEIHAHEFHGFHGSELDGELKKYFGDLMIQIQMGLRMI